MNLFYEVNTNVYLELFSFPVQEIVYFFLDVIDVADTTNTNLLSLKCLLKTKIIYQNSSAISRRSFKLLNDKLSKIDMMANSKTELAPLIEQFLIDFQYHEL